MSTPDTGDTAQTPDAPLLFDRYRLLEKLGEGRLATVYHAADERLQRDVLVHILRTELQAQEPLRQRFLEEISASAQLTHSVLLDVFDSGETGQRPFMVTEYITGRPLYQQGAFAPDRVVVYMRQLISAVAVCQVRSLPHPPISSRNVILVDNDRLEFVESWLTPQAEVALDLAHYRPPEITEGSPPSPAGAVYALGLLLYEMLTGQRAVQGSTPAEVAQAHLSLRLPTVSRARPLLYLPAVDRLLSRATARYPQQRLPDAATLADALEEAWRGFGQDTQRLAIAATPLPLPQYHEQGRAATAALPRAAARAQPAARPPQTPAPAAPRAPQAPAPAAPRAAPRRPNLSRKRSRRGPGWLVLVSLLLLVAVVSYVVASFAVDRLFAIQLPGLRQLVPQVTLPDFNLDVPDWLAPPETDEILIVNINEGLNLRDAPGLETTVIAVVPNGTPVRKLAGPQMVDGVPWVQVRIENTDGEPLEGWMSLNFLEQE